MKILFEELKRRNVIRVGVAYLVAGWVLLQIGDVVFDFLDVPDWAGKLLVALLALGFPLALIFAWAFELTPEGLKAEADIDRSRSVMNVTGKKLDMITIALVITALGVFAADKLLDTGRAPVTSDSTTTAAPAPEASVAVLPFENISMDAANEPFTIGIHDDLLTQISKIGSLKTISRSSVLRYRDRTMTVPQIAAELGVATVLEGGVQRAGDRVRINVQLIDAQSNKQIWAERYERQLTAANIFVIQSEIVKAIADALQTTLSSDEQSRIEKVPTENLAALELYFLGRQGIASRNTSGIKEAIEYYQQAIELDPDFALAYVGLSDGYQLLEDAGGLSRNEMFAKSGPALEKAMQLDAQLGPAYASLGGMTWTAGDYPDAQAMFRKSIELSPNYSTAYLWYGLLLVDWGRVDEAIPVYRKGIERDPLSPQLNESFGYALELRGQFDQALHYYWKSAELSTTFSTSYIAIGNLYWMALGRMHQAVACHKKSIDRDSGARLPRTYLGLLYLDLDDVGQAETWIGSSLRLAPESIEPLAAMALLDEYRGDEKGALRNAAAAQKISPYFPASRLLHTMVLAILRNHDLQEGRPADARVRYEENYPVLLQENEPIIDFQNFRAAIDVARLLQETGDNARAARLLQQSAMFIESGSIARLGIGGYGIADVQIYALLDERQRALTALRRAIDQGWRGFWWFYLKNNPNLESLRDSTDFQAMVQEVASLMTTDRATLGEATACTEP